MKKLFTAILLFIFWGCAERNSFLVFNLVASNANQVIEFDTLNVDVTTVSNGTKISKKVTFEDFGIKSIPASFFLEFKKDSNDTSISIIATGVKQNNVVFRANTTATIADTEEIKLEITFCGDGTINDGEECDDGNRIDDDRCDSDCSLAEVIQISMGIDHTCALLDYGGVRCWGANNNGELGNPDKDIIGDDELPSDIGDIELGEKVIQISSGFNHTCALLASQNLKCWGAGSDGQLGYGNTENVGDDETPQSVGDVPLGELVDEIHAGGFSTCAILVTGNLRCWGANFAGQLGYGNTTPIGDNELPNSVGVLGIGKPSDLATYGNHSCALFDNGKFRCWGSGNDGALGYGNTNNIGDNELPSSTNLLDLSPDAEKLADGSLALGFTCIILINKTIQCWGKNNNGQLGYGNTNNLGDNESPFDAGVVSLPLGVASISLGTSHACAVQLDGNVICWGSGFSGALGYGSTNNVGDDELPIDAGNVDIGDFVTQIATGSTSTCVLLRTGQVKCWGTGILGFGNLNIIGDNETPSEIGEISIASF